MITCLSVYPMDLVDEFRPPYTCEEAKGFLKELYGLEGMTIRELPSYDDRNFRVSEGEKHLYVLKINALQGDSTGTC